MARSRKAKAVRGIRGTELPSDIRVSERAYRELDLVTQFRLCRELVDTRHAELMLAYRNVLNIGYGFKTSRRLDNLQIEKVNTRRPCIIFVVLKKWRSGGRAKKDQIIPPRLYTYVTVGKKRVRCAIRTDIKVQSSFGKKGRAHLAESERPFGVAVESDSERTWGVITCAIKRPDDPALIYALSCRHVFSMSLGGPEVASGCSVRLSGSDKVLGVTTGIRGVLVPAPDVSFDAQLARVTSQSELRAALPGIRFDPQKHSASDESEVPSGGFWILTPRRDARGKRLKIWVSPRDYLTKTLPYDNLEVLHYGLLHAVADDRLRPGDSGSPAVTVSAGGMLLGMYLGGDGRNAYIIPAWQLVRGAYYRQMGESLWKVVNP